MRHMRVFLTDSDHEALASGRDADTQARHSLPDLLGAPCPACSPAAYADQSARHRADRVYTLRQLVQAFGDGIRSTRRRMTIQG